MIDTNNKDKSQKYPTISIIIPTHNRRRKLVRLVKSILLSDYPKDKLEIIVVDDASTDGTYEYIRDKFPWIKVIRNPKERFLSLSRNIGIRCAKGDYIFLIDDDGIVTPKTLRILVSYMESNPQIGAANPIILVYKSRYIWTAGVKVDMWTTRVIPIKCVKHLECDWLSGHAIIVRKEVFRRIGGFSALFPLEREDLDFSLRVKKAGFKLGICTNAIVYHDVSPRRFANPHREYFRARSRVLFHLLYSRSTLQKVISLLFSIGISLFYVIELLINVHNNKIKKCLIIRSILRGLKDGLQLYKQIMRVSSKYYMVKGESHATFK